MKTIVRFLIVAVLLCVCSSALFAADPSISFTAKRADGTTYTIIKKFYRSPSILTSRSGAPLEASMNFAGYPGFVDFTAAQKVDLDRYKDSVLEASMPGGYHRVISATLGFGLTDLFWRPIDETQQLYPWPYVWECDWLNLAWPLNYAAEYYPTCIIWNGAVSYGSFNIQVGDLVGGAMYPNPTPGLGSPVGVVVAINPNNPCEMTVRKKEGGYGLYDELWTVNFTPPNLTVGMTVWRSAYGAQYIPSAQYPPYLFW